MKLIEALAVANRSRSAALPMEHTLLACGFTPLHLRTFLEAELQLRRPSHRAVVETGVFGDLAGTIAGTARAEVHAAAVVIEWSDLDSRLGFRTTGGWSPAATSDVLETTRLALDRLDAALEALASRMPVVVSTPTLPLPPIDHTPGWQAGAVELAVRSLVGQFAERIARLPRVRVLSPHRLDQRSPSASRADLRSDLGTGFPYSQPHASVLAELLAGALAPAAPKKGLITDLDDTLWRGLLGEVGVAGVAWSLERKAHAHALYQQLLATLAESGVLIAVASKNDPGLVKQAFARDDLLVREEHVFPILAHWGAKSESVSRILETWNIGADSVVFVDDSPIELAEVQAVHPEVTCLRYQRDDPGGVAQLLATLRDLFGRPALLAEDQLRARSLRRAGHVRAATAATDATDFLASAQAEITFAFSRDASDPRAFELVNKTNQFNLNGRRYTEAEWMAALQHPDSFLLTVSYRDKFGPLGNIGVVLGCVADGVACVDTWVLSCRAFARRIEHRTTQVLFEHLGVDRLSLSYRGTERNGPLREFLTECGFDPAATGPCQLGRDALLRHPPLHHIVTVTSSLPPAHG